jgi:heme-degrading monooxygenase HmoA
MIARVWRGVVRRADGDRYAAYMRATGVKEYAETAGNRSVLMLRRDDGERSEFVMVTLWESWEAVRAFASDDVDRAVFYPEDDAFLIERDLTATHYQVAEARGI